MLYINAAAHYHEDDCYFKNKQKTHLTDLFKI